MPLFYLASIDAGYHRDVALKRRLPGKVPSVVWGRTCEFTRLIALTVDTEPKFKSSCKQPEGTFDSFICTEASLQYIGMWCAQFSATFCADVATPCRNGTTLQP